MARTYQKVIAELKAKGKAEITVSSDNLATAIQGVKRLKSEDNVMRKRLGLIRFSRLKITKQRIEGTSLWKVSFEFIYATNHL